MLDDAACLGRLQRHAGVPTCALDGLSLQMQHTFWPPVQGMALLADLHLLSPDQGLALLWGALSVAWLDLSPASGGGH